MTPRVYLDANFLIRVVEDEPARIANHVRIWELIEDGRIAAVSSWLTWSEVLVHPMRQNETSLVDVYDNIFLGRSFAFEVAEVDRAVLRASAELRAETPTLKSPDAIHIATARLSGCAWFLSSDRRLPLGPGIMPVDPDRSADIDRFLTQLP